MAYMKETYLSSFEQSLELTEEQKKELEQRIAKEDAALGTVHLESEWGRA